MCEIPGRDNDSNRCAAEKIAFKPCELNEGFIGASGMDCVCDKWCIEETWLDSLKRVEICL